MSGIHVRRWLLAGVVAGAIVWLLEGVASILYIDEMTAAMEAHDLSMEMSVEVWLISIAVSLLAGLVVTFIYVGLRPRFGPGPRTAVIAALTLWVGGYLLSLVGYHMMGLFPDGLLVAWGLIGLLEMILGSLAGAWVYRE